MIRMTLSGWRCPPRSAKGPLSSQFASARLGCRVRSSYRRHCARRGDPCSPSPRRCLGARRRWESGLSGRLLRHRLDDIRPADPSGGPRRVQQKRDHHRRNGDGIRGSNSQRLGPCWFSGMVGPSPDRGLRGELTLPAEGAARTTQAPGRAIPIRDRPPTRSPICPERRGCRPGGAGRGRRSAAGCPSLGRRGRCR